MSAAFEEAWSLLKAAFMPTDPDQQLGTGMFRSVYGEQGNPDVTKFGYAGLADMATLDTLAQMYPELFIGERPAYLDMPQSNVPDWLMMRPDGTPIADTRELGTTAGMPLPSVQQRGTPLDKPDGYKSHQWLQSRGKPILGSIYNKYPLTEAMQMWDIKPENWIGMPSGAMNARALGHPVTAGAKLMDPQFLAPAHTYGPPTSVNVNPRVIDQFASKLPEIEDFARPWEQMVERHGTPAHEDSFEDMLMNEEERLQLIRNRLGL